MTQIALAPMEGLADAMLRDLLTAHGGIDWCVTEFVRISDRLLPAAAVQRIAPELKQGSQTAAGTELRVQLLGSDPVCMAENAAQIAGLGAAAIDLNFGCPAKTVNRPRGGAVLLREPETLHHIVAAVRAALPAEVPVTAKMRLGYSDTSQALECAQALAAAGAAEIAVHARTREQGYTPPADWDWLARIREAVSVPVVPNGDVTGLDSYRRIADISGCDQVMIGRGLVACPDLALRIQQSREGQVEQMMSWAALQPWLADFYIQVRAQVAADRHVPGRLKQWLVLLGNSYPEARALFDGIRRETCAQVLQDMLLCPVPAQPAPWPASTTSLLSC